MKNIMKKLIAVILGFSIILKENIVKATDINSWIPPRGPEEKLVSLYGVPKTTISGINVITNILVFIGAPIVLILGLDVYMKKVKQAKNRNIIVQIFGRLILAISLFLSFIKTIFTILDYNDYTDYILEEILILAIMMISPITIFRYLVKKEIIKSKEKIILRIIMLLLLLSLISSIILMILIEVGLL